MIACELEHDAFELGYMYSKEENEVYVAMAFLDTYSYITPNRHKLLWSAKGSKFHRAGSSAMPRHLSV